MNLQIMWLSINNHTQALYGVCQLFILWVALKLFFFQCQQKVQKQPLSLTYGRWGQPPKTLRYPYHRVMSSKTYAGHLAEESKADFAHRLCCCVSFHYQIFRCSTSHLPFCSTVFNLVSYNSSLVAEPTTAKSKRTHVTNCLYESCNSESTF